MSYGVGNVYYGSILEGGGLVFGFCIFLYYYIVDWEMRYENKL